MDVLSTQQPQLQSSKLCTVCGSFDLQICCILHAACSSCGLDFAEPSFVSTLPTALRASVPWRAYPATCSCVVMSIKTGPWRVMRWLCWPSSCRTGSRSTRSRKRYGRQQTHFAALCCAALSDAALLRSLFSMCLYCRCSLHRWHASGSGFWVCCAMRHSLCHVLCIVCLQLAELGLLPEGDADPMTLADKLTQLAIDANDDEVRVNCRVAILSTVGCVTCFLARMPGL